MTEQEKHCIEQINNFLNMCKKTETNDINLYIHISQSDVFDKTLFPYKREYINLTSSKDDICFYKCPLLGKNKVRPSYIISKLNQPFTYKEDNVKYKYGETLKNSERYYYPYYEKTL
jgi:hypothetical protein